MRRSTIPLWIGAALLMIAATTPDKTPRQYFNARLNSRWLQGTNGDVLTGYPAQEDTTGKGKLCVYVGGERYLWYFEADSTDVYQINETAGADSSLAHLDRLWIQTPAAPESLITNTRQIGVGAIATANLADNSVTDAKRDSIDGGTEIKYQTITADRFAVAAGKFDASVDFDTLKVNVLEGTTMQGQTGKFALVTAYPGGPLALGAHQIDGNTQVTGAYTFDVGTGAATFDGDVTLGDNSGDAITINGVLTATSDAIIGTSVADTTGFGGRATFADGITLDQYVYDKESVRDSLAAGTRIDTVLVPSVSDIIGDGEICACEVRQNWTAYQLINDVSGGAYNRTLFASPFSQAAATGDSVFVYADSTVSDVTPYWVSCKAVD